MSVVVVPALLALLSQGPAPALGETPPARHVTVSGEGVVEVEPDRAILRVAVVTEGKDLQVLKSENDQRVRRTLEVARRFGVPAKDLQTGRITLQERYGERGERDGFVVNKAVTIQLDQLSRFEALLTALIEAGTNRVESVELLSSQEEEHKARARVLAVKDARAKATALARELGQQLGEPLVLVEEGEPSAGPVHEARMMRGDQAAFAPGRVRVTAHVRASFALEGRR